MMLTDTNNTSAIYNLKEVTDSSRTTESEPIVSNRPSSPRKFFERLYGHLEKGNPTAPCDQPSVVTENACIQTSDIHRSPSVSSDSTCRSSPTLDIEDTEELNSFYGDEVQTGNSYNQRTYPGYTASQSLNQSPFGQQGLAAVQPLTPLVGSYGGGTFRPFFGLGPDGSQIPAGLSAFCK